MFMAAAANCRKLPPPAAEGLYDGACDHSLGERAGGEGRHTTNSNTDWTKTKQSPTSLVHATGLTNGHPSK
jgi:hypothetical protein